MANHHTDEQVIIKTSKVTFYEVRTGPRLDFHTRTFSREEAANAAAAVPLDLSPVVVELQAVVLPDFLYLSRRRRLCVRVPREGVPAEVDAACPVNGGVGE